MLLIEIPKTEVFNEKTQTFEIMSSCKVQLEHSLLSISKWESEWNEPFLSNQQLTVVKFRDYIRCMAIGTYDPSIFLCLSNDNYKEIKKYIDRPMTATTFKKTNGRPNREIATSEILYYRMISNGIPFECQKWHLNRLLALIRVCDEKNVPARKMSRQETATRNKQLNDLRRKQYNSRG